MRINCKGAVRILLELQECSKTGGDGCTNWLIYKKILNCTLRVGESVLYKVYFTSIMCPFLLDPA